MFLVHRITRIFLALTVGIVALLALPASPAHASEEVIKSFQNLATGRCVDHSLEWGLRPYPCNGGPWQQWDETASGGGMQYRNRATGFCLDDSAQYRLRAYPCNGGIFQRWIRGTIGADTVLTNWATNLVLDDSVEHNLRTLRWNGGPWQRWR